ncbi:hypothetical protein [Spirosoma pomorum]
MSTLNFSNQTRQTLLGQRTFPAHPTTNQDAEYIVFVRDRKTGDTAYSTIVVKAPVDKERHLIRMPGGDYKMKFCYMATGALPANPSRK